MKIILGPPGTGKTTKLINILEKELSEGIDPMQVGFVSFTRKGAYEAKERVMRKFGFYQNELPHFRTLHSMAYRATGVQKNQVMERSHWKKLGELLGIDLSGNFDPEEPPDASSRRGDRMFFLEEYARNTMQPLRKVWQKYGEGVCWNELDLAERTLRKFKQTYGLIDFTDMVEMFINEGHSIPVEVAIVDEAQDNSTLQWKMFHTGFRGAKRIYVAGDDDQSVYRWAGADVEHFLGLKGEKEYLRNSHRLPVTIYDIAKRIACKIKNRFEKEFYPKEEKGAVYYHNYPDYIDFNEEGTWLVLARNRYLLKSVEERVRSLGLSYSTRFGKSIKDEHSRAIYAWEQMRKGKLVGKSEAELAAKFSGKISHFSNDLVKYSDITNQDVPWYDAFFRMSSSDIEYYRAILRNGGNLKEKPLIHFSTIHGVKGGEADNVVVISDVSSRTNKNFDENPDDEHRVFYVGVTRARKSLHIILPQTDCYYRIPRFSSQS